MNRRMMEKALSQIDDRFVQESLEKMTAENKGKSKAGKYEAPGSGGVGRKFLILVLAACLVFALAAVAYAANVWGIREMFRTELRELPEAVVEDIQVHTETAAAEDWSARVTESYCDGSKILMTVEVSGGDRYVLAPTYVEPQSSIGEIGLSGEQTLEDYAREQGKELLFVGASLMQNEGLGIFTEGQNNRSTSPTEMVILVESDRSNADPVESAVCRVYATTADGTSKNLEIPFTLGAAPIQGEEVYVPIDPDAIPGITVGNATVTKTSLGVTVRYQETITDQEAAYSILKRESPELPGLMGGFVEDGSREIILTMGQGEIPDQLTIRYYDEDKAYMGEIVFEKQ
ncbi:MAG TPA: hypothetical protein IAC30_07515 [Candidatus Faecousia intestinavium]|nr:hypothetical protein [Candidatus Faecousia intestinavium]